MVIKIEKFFLRGSRNLFKEGLTIGMALKEHRDLILNYLWISIALTSITVLFTIIAGSLVESLSCFILGLGTLGYYLLVLKQNSLDMEGRSCNIGRTRLFMALFLQTAMSIIAIGIKKIFAFI